MAFYRLNPFGLERFDYLASMQVAATLNAAGRRRPVKINDVLPNWAGTRKQKSDEELVQFFRDFAARYNAQRQSDMARKRGKASGGG